MPTKKPRDLLHLNFGTPVPGERPTLEIIGTKKTMVDWMNGHAKMETRIGTVDKAHKAPTGMVGSRDSLTAANHRLGHPYLS